MLLERMSAALAVRGGGGTLGAASMTASPSLPADGATFGLGACPHSCLGWAFINLMPIRIILPVWFRGGYVA